LITRLAALFAWALATGAPAQQPGAPAPANTPLVLHSESRLVLVDVVARDKQGKLAPDLEAQDFKLWEDGKEQGITSFFTAQDSSSPERGQKRYLVLFFDDANLLVSEQVVARRDAAKFISTWAAPDRYMAVVSFSGNAEATQNFTARPEVLERAALTVQPSQIAASSAGLAADESAQGGGRGGGGRGGGGRGGASGPSSTAANATVLMTRPALLNALLAVVDTMAAVRGRKSIALFGGGPPDTPLAAAETVLVANACNRANVAVYLMNPSALHSLAAETGGRELLNPNNLLGELGRIADDEEQHYVLGYYPAVAEGSCHALRVAVERKGVDIWARKGYCSAKPPDILAGNASEKALEARAASPAAGTLAASIETPYFYSSAGAARVNVAMEIDAAGIKFQKVKGKPHADLNVVGIASQPGGQVAGRFSDSVKLDFDSDKEAAAFAKRPYHYEYQFDLGPGQYTLRVAFGSGEESSGKVEVPLAIDPWDGKRLAISGIAVATQARSVPDLVSGLEDVLLEDRKPLIARAVQVIPSGDNRCRSAAPCMAYLEVYEPLLAGASPPGIAIQYRILDRPSSQSKYDSGRLNAGSFVRPGNPVVPIVFELPANQLAAGAYRLEVRALRAPTGDFAVRTVDFDIQ
jgi:VWFA-related protein